MSCTFCQCFDTVFFLCFLKGGGDAIFFLVQLVEKICDTIKEISMSDSVNWRERRRNQSVELLFFLPVCVTKFFYEQSQDTDIAAHLHGPLRQHHLAWILAGLHSQYLAHLSVSQVREQGQNGCHGKLPVFESL